MFLVLFLRCFSVGGIVTVAALVEGVLGDSFRFFKGFVVGRNFREALVYGLSGLFFRMDGK